MKGLDINALKAALTDNFTHIAVAKIDKLDLASDRSVLRVVCTIFPELNRVVARMTWEQVGPNAGVFGFPAVGDLVLLGFADKDMDQCFVLKRLTSQEDKIPLQAADGSTVVRALAGKKAHLLSDTAVLLGRGGADPTEPLVLGNVFKEAYSSHLGLDAAHKHIGNLGYLTFVPDNASDMLDVKASPVDDDAMLSDLAKTEK
jgi:hypothetical protein